MKLQSEKARTDFKRRLRRIEGQIRGIQGMVDDERACREIVQQLNAAAAAMSSASKTFMHAYAQECLVDAETQDRQQTQLILTELIDMMAGSR